MRRLALFVLAAACLAGCGDDDGDEVVPDAALVNEADAAAATPDAAAQTDPDGGADAPGGSVTWSPELPNPYIFPAPGEDPEFGGVAVDFFLQYTVELPNVTEPPPQLEVEICTLIAGATEPVCDGQTNAAVQGPGGYRWGFDPSTYDVGHNEYTHSLRLTQGGELIDEAVLVFEINATYDAPPE